MSAPDDAYPIFDIFCQCLTEEGRAGAEEFMEDVDLPNEILTLYTSEKEFSAAVEFARTIEFARANFVPLEKGGLIYLRLATPDVDTFKALIEEIGRESQETFSTPAELLDFTMPPPEETARISEALLASIESGDGAETARELTSIHGSLKEVVFLDDTEGHKSILVFEDSTEIPAGTGTFMPFLVFGRGGPDAPDVHDSSAFSAFLSEASFALTDVSEVRAPLIVKADGSTVEGERVGGTVEWADGREGTPVWDGG